MRIRPNVFNNAIGFVDRHRRLKDRFIAFVNDAKRLEDQLCPLRGVTLQISDDYESFQVTFLTVQIELRYTARLRDDDNVLRGQVDCRLIRPLEHDADADLGSFTFDANGTTDIDVEPGGERHEMELGATMIVVNLLDAALRR